MLLMIVLLLLMPGFGRLSTANGCLLFQLFRTEHYFQDYSNYYNSQMNIAFEDFKCKAIVYVNHSIFLKHARIKA